jgi:hypothetical protein
MPVKSIAAPEVEASDIPETSGLITAVLSAIVPPPVTLPDVSSDRLATELLGFWIVSSFSVEAIAVSLVFNDG